MSSSLPPSSSPSLRADNDNEPFISTVYDYEWDDDHYRSKSRHGYHYQNYNYEAQAQHETFHQPRVPFTSSSSSILDASSNSNNWPICIALFVILLYQFRESIWNRIRIQWDYAWEFCLVMFERQRGGRGQRRRRRGGILLDLLQMRRVNPLNATTETRKSDNQAPRGTLSANGNARRRRQQAPQQQEQQQQGQRVHENGSAANKNGGLPDLYCDEEEESLNGSNYINDALGPAFTSQDDYPTYWLVYDHEEDSIFNKTIKEQQISIPPVIDSLSSSSSIESKRELVLEAH